MINILNKIYKEDRQAFYAMIKRCIEQEEKAFIVTANPETIMLTYENSELEKILLNDEVTIIPDGIGVVKGAKKLGIHIQERIPGIELVETLLDFLNETKKTIYFYGSKQEVLDKLANKLESEYPGISVLGLKNGYDNEDAEVFKDIQEKKPDVILVAHGIPKQELIIDRYYNKLQKGICIGVGGSLDVLSGAKKRAPMIFRKLNIEWLYRIIKEPSRIKRFCKYNLKLILVLKKIKNINKNT